MTGHIGIMHPRSSTQPTFTRTEKLRARAEANRIRKQAKAEQRRRDRELVTGDVAQILGLTIAEVAQAMRAAGVTERLTASEAKTWANGVDMPEWLGVLHGERLARAAKEEHRKQQAEKDRQLRELMAEEGAISKVRSGAHRNRFNKVS